ncbi:MAG: ComEC/Rec2 family competence protein [Nitrososphaeraceae archaeon]
MVKKIIDDDLVRVFKKDTKKFDKIITWGDEIEIVGKYEDFYEIKLDENDSSNFLIKKDVKLINPDLNKVLKISFVDVQQGDASIIETPNKKIIFVDGGENQLFARYLAARYNKNLKDDPLIVDAIIITHGDADHFSGLTEIYRSEKNSNKKKRLFIFPKRIYHNGIVKGRARIDGKTVKVEKIFGKTIMHENKLYLIDLVDDLLKVDKNRFNTSFNKWTVAIRNWNKRYQDRFEPVIIKRLQYNNGVDNSEFDFLDDGVSIKIFGPDVQFINKKQSALPILHKHSATRNMLQIEEAEEKPISKSYSASHTINGHSIVLQLKYGNVKFFLSGDINHESEIKLNDLVKKKKIDINSEILKVPHHGSSDFDAEFLSNVKPVISIISSGDESVMKEHIHPRANLVGALGRYSRTKSPLIFITELAAFFKKIGYTSHPKEEKKKFFAFERTQFGIVHIKTNGTRVLVFTHSGKINLKEAYAFSVDKNGRIKPQQVIKK